MKYRKLSRVKSNPEGDMNIKEAAQPRAWCLSKVTKQEVSWTDPITKTVYYDRPSVLAHELAHVKLGHATTRWIHLRGDVQFWAEMDAQLYPIIKYRNEEQVELLDWYQSELAAPNSDMLYYTRKSVSRLLKKGHITSHEANWARMWLREKYK